MQLYVTYSSLYARIARVVLILPNELVQPYS